jgi:hypothetical protein
MGLDEIFDELREGDLRFRQCCRGFRTRVQVRVDVEVHAHGRHGRHGSTIGQPKNTLRETFFPVATRWDLVA